MTDTNTFNVRYSFSTIVWHTRRHFKSASRRICVAEGNKGVRPSVVKGVWLVRLTTVPCLLSCHFQICYLWTASVEPADSYPTGSPTSRAFYSCGSGLLWDSDFVASVTSQSVSLLSPTPCQQGPRVPGGPQQVPSATPNHKTSISICVDSFIQVTTS